MKYKVGDKIRYVGHYSTTTEDIGKAGVVVAILQDKNSILIYLPKSDHVSCFSPYNGELVTWETGASSLELLYKKNEQLLFPFMEESLTE